MKHHTDMPEPPPGTLYRFRSIADEHSIGALKAILCESRIWLSSPARFNDPFECRPRFSFEGTPAELTLFAEHSARVLHAKLGYQGLREETRRIRRALTENAEQNERRLEAHFRSFGILCLSEAIEDILTWSHYADGHRGVALGFTVPAKPLSIFNYVRKVLYQDEYPVCRLFNISDDTSYEAVLLTKASGWKYEREWRVIVHTNSNGFRTMVEEAARKKEMDPDLARLLLSERGEGEYTFPATVLTEIVLGAQIAPDKRRMIMEWVAARPERVRVRQAVQHRTSFGLQLHEVSYEHRPVARIRTSPELSRAVTAALALRSGRRDMPGRERENLPPPLALTTTTLP